MSRKKTKALNRLLAAVLSIIMVLTMIPMTTLTSFAAIVGTEFVVRDAETNETVESAVVTIVNEALGINASAETDSAGIVSFTNIDIGDSIEGSVNYTISKEGYETKTGEAQLNGLQVQSYLEPVAATVQKTVMVNVIGEATIKLNDVVQNTIAAEEGSEVKIEIIPEEGSYIKSLSKNDTVQEIPEKGQAFHSVVQLDADIVFNALVVKEHTVTVNSGEEGNITLNGNNVSSLTVEDNSLVVFEVNPNEGYRIGSVVINGTNQVITDSSVFNTELAITEDVVIMVSYVKVYTMEVSYNQNGSVITAPEGAGGKVIVEAGTEVKIQAIPDANYRVESVTINDVEDTSINGNNNEGYSNTLMADKDYRVVITFAPNIYIVSVNKPENGTTEIESALIEHNGSTKITISPDDSFMVNTVSVNNIDVTSTIVKDAAEIYFVIDNITENQAVEITFKEIGGAKDGDFSVDTTHSVRQDGNLYVIKSGAAIIFSTEKDGIAVYDTDGVLIGGGVAEHEVSVEETKNIGHVKVYYKADGDVYADWHMMICELKIAVDTKKPEANLDFSPEANQNGYFNSDITVSVVATDSGDYSGLATVEYWITKDEVDGARTEFALEDNAIKADGNTFIVKATDYNSSDVKINVRVVDKAGNEETYTESLKINCIAPTVSLDISGNENTNALDTFYNDTRELTITIVDREDTFDKVAVASGLKIKKDGVIVTVDEDDINWQNGEPNIFIGTYEFSDDGKYEWTISYTNKAGMTNEGFKSVPEGKDLFAFTIDKIAPYNLSVSYNPTFIGTLLENFTFGFYQAPVTVIIEATDDTSGIASFTYTYTGIEEKTVSAIPDELVTGRYFASFVIPVEFRGMVSFSAMDKAGRTTSLEDNRVVVIDTIAPGITVEYDPASSSCGNYFNGKRIATITITEANFFEADLEEGLLLITVGKRLSSKDDYTYTNVKPSFTRNGDVYSCKIEFEEDAWYTFDIKYTDRSGNVFDSYPMDEFVIDTINPIINVGFINNTCINGNKFNDNRKALIRITEHNFDASKVVANVYKNGNPSDEFTSVLQNPESWTVIGDVYTAEIPFTEDAHYTFSIECIDLAGHDNGEVVYDEGTVAPNDFYVDKEAPINLKISYVPDFVGTFLELFSYGFYKAPVKVTIEAVDKISGVDYFVYSYTVQNDVSPVNVGKENINVEAERDEGSDRYYATFEIPAQFRGHVSFEVFDYAGNGSDFADANNVVVDDKAPIINVEYNNNDAKYGEYYDTDRTAKIIITEANYFEQDLDDGLLVITVGKRLNNEKEYTYTNKKQEFFKNGDVYTSEITFNEDADYSLEIKYTDRSGNVAEFKDQFTIDKIEPGIEVSYNNNISKNDDQFNNDREATITITEHNFNAADVDVSVIASGTDLLSYKEYLTDDTNWIHSGDVHTAKIYFTEEAHYEFAIACTDMAGNLNSGVDYGDSIAPTKFTIDKSAPTELNITINDESVLHKNEVGDIPDTNSVVFDKFYARDIVIKLDANCDISGCESLKYQKVTSVSEYNEDGDWVTYNAESGILVSPSEKFIVYFRAEDRAGNISIVNSTGIVVDNMMPVGETRAPEIDIFPSASNENNIHSGNVKVDLKVSEPKYSGTNADENGYYSGIEKISYKIYTLDTEAVVAGVLLDETNGIKDGAVIDEDNLISSWTGSIEIDSHTFNSNSVLVEIIAVDNAGNTRVSTTNDGEIRIDVTAPIIDVSYDNNTPDSEIFFKHDRIANIVVTERNFREEDVFVNVTRDGSTHPISCTWTKINGTGNLDDTKWITSIAFTVDGDYDFAVEYTDLAGWKCAKENVKYGTSVAPTRFTIDHISPTIEVTYDNNSALNSNYYQEDRTATIVVTERNFDESRVIINLRAVDDGKNMDVPKVSGWKSVDDKHTATIHYNKDSHYFFDISIRDKAGNDSNDFVEHDFYVDKTAPIIDITGVADLSANNGEVIPVISYSDTNYEAENVVITLIGANRKDIPLDGNYGVIHNGGTFTFKDFAKEKEIDDIYTLTVALTDKAGNTSTETITFSVNRFGSTYALSEETAKLNGTYVKKPVDVVITETNVNELSDIIITLFKNNETIILSEGSDYKIDIDGGNGKWYHYTYTIFAKNFDDDAVYSITIESDDAAGNKAKNDHDTKNTTMSFGVDDILPIINIENLNSKTTYAVDNLTVKMSIKDNLKLTKVIVELDQNKIKVWEAEELEEIIKNGGNFSFNILGDSTDAHNLVVYAVDAAGNGEKIFDSELPANAEEVVDFYVTTNLWVRYYTNKPLFFGSIAGVILMVGLMVIWVVYEKKKVLREE